MKKVISFTLEEKLIEEIKANADTLGLNLSSYVSLCCGNYKVIRKRKPKDDKKLA